MRSTASKAINRIIFYAIAIVIAIVFLTPTVFMLSTSFQTEEDVYRLPPKWIPRTPTVEPYRFLLDTFPVLQWAWNTFLYAVFTVVLQLILVSLAAYPFSRMDFYGKNILFLVILSTIMVPFEVKMIPLYLVTYRIGLLDNIWGLILPNIAAPFGLFLFVQFFRQIPKELEDSAMIDGCNRFQIFARIIVPVTRNVFVILAILIVVYCWNDFFWPLIILSTERSQVLSIGVFNLLASNLMVHVGYPLAMAGCVVMAMPLVVVYIVFQKYIINAYLFTGLKG